MRLEDEIKQSKFKNEFHKATLNIIFTAAWLNGEHTRFFKKYGISPQQYNILRILRGQHPKPATINLLIERMLDKMSNASRLVEKLRLKEFVERCANEKDRRAVDVVITKKGIDLLTEIDTTSLESIGKISEEDAVVLNKILDKFRESKT